MNADRSRRQPGTTSRARGLRRADNQSEATLWNEIKDRRLGGFKFVRQLPIGPFFADFACRRKKLVIEIDGSQHADNVRDRRREDFMRRAGFSTLRFWNVDVITKTTEVCDTILAALNDQLTESTTAVDLRFVQSRPHPLTGRFAATSPPHGEGEEETLEDNR